MVAQYFVQILFTVAGTIALLAALLNWDWFFTAQNTQILVKNIGRKKARFFYGTLGIILIGAAVFFFFQS